MNQVKLVINFDLPVKNEHGFIVPDFKNYMHRIGRAGRFGDTGLVLTILDNDKDERFFWQIIEKYQMKDNVQKFEGGHEKLSELLQKANEESIY